MLHGRNNENILHMKELLFPWEKISFVPAMQHGCRAKPLYRNHERPHFIIFYFVQTCIHAKPVQHAPRNVICQIFFHFHKTQPQCLQVLVALHAFSRIFHCLLITLRKVRLFFACLAKLKEISKSLQI